MTRYCTVSTDFGFPGQDTRTEEAELLGRGATHSNVRFLNTEDVTRVHNSRVSNIHTNTEGTES